jgi:hypothetical protein
MLTFCSGVCVIATDSFFVRRLTLALALGIDGDFKSRFSPNLFSKTCLVATLRLSLILFSRIVLAKTPISEITNTKDAKIKTYVEFLGGHGLGGT